MVSDTRLLSNVDIKPPNERVTHLAVYRPAYIRVILTQTQGHSGCIS